jgi:hypothetical protein
MIIKVRFRDTPFGSTQGGLHQVGAELFYPDLKEQAVFTVPTRALANDKLAEWRARASASSLRLTQPPLQLPI